MTQLIVLQTLPRPTWVHDSGPIYKETLTNTAIVEPWNTFSNLIFLAILVYFVILLYRSPGRHLFLKFALPIIGIGWIGGTLYHALRESEVWLVMDWLPITLLCLAAACYFAIRAMSVWWGKLGLLLLVLIVSFGSRFITYPDGWGVSLGYVATAMGILLPVFVFGYRTDWKYFVNVVFALVAFAFAISFRTMDGLLPLEFMYMGTHWLWHILGGTASYFILRYIYRVESVSTE